MAFIQLIDTLGFGRGGLTKSIYERLTYVSKKEETILVVTGMQFEVDRVASVLKKENIIPESVKVIGLFDHAFGNDKTIIEPPIPNLNKEVLYQTKESSESSTVIRYFDQQGRFVGLENFTADNRLNYLEVHSSEFPHICRARQLYDSAGKVRCVKYFDYTWKPRFETVFHSSGKPIYSCWLTETGSRYRIVSFGQGIDSQIVKDFYDVRQILLENIIKEYPNSILVSDEPSTIPFISRNYEFNKLVKKGIGYIHTTHTYQSNGIEKMKPWFYDYKLNSGSLSLILCTNKIQADELKKVIVGATNDNVMALTHAIELKDNISAKQYPLGKLLYLGRLSDEKRVDLVIKSFNLALKKLPHLTLDIVGDGPLKSELVKLVNSLGISNSVTFHGYSLEVDKWFQQADCHFLTSKFEGFPLVLIEGLSNACPCIVSPCKYGPDQIIENGVNGLRDKAEPEALSKAIIKLYGGNTLSNLSQGALRTVVQYSKSEWRKNWDSILQS